MHLPPPIIGLYVCSLILRNISKIGATRCQILRRNYTKFTFRWGSAPNPVWELTTLPVTLAVLKGPTSKGRRGEGEAGRGEKER